MEKAHLGIRRQDGFAVVTQDDDTCMCTTNGFDRTVLYKCALNLHGMHGLPVCVRSVLRESLQCASRALLAKHVGDHGEW